MTSPKAEIVAICKRLHMKNFIAAADGNVSVRLDHQEILITPTAKHKGYIEEQDIATIDLEGRTVEGAPSGERRMHLEVYRACPMAKAVVHAHPPTAVAWSVARPELEELPANALSEVILAVGRIPIVSYAQPGSEEMGTNLLPYLPDNRCMILARHGALAWGESLQEAYNGMERLEHAALILKNAHQLGGITNLDKNEVEKLREMRSQLGPKSL